MLIEHNAYTDYQNQNLDYIASQIEKFNDVSEKLYSLIDDVNQSQQQYKDMLNDLTNEFYKLKTSTADSISEIRNLVVNYNGTITNSIIDINDRITAQNDHIETVLKDIGDNIILYNPFVGYNTTLQDIINSLSNLNRVRTLTIGELDKLKLTVQQFDDLNISFYDMDWNNKAILDTYL